MRGLGSKHLAACRAFAFLVVRPENSKYIETRLPPKNRGGVRIDGGGCLKAQGGPKNRGGIRIDRRGVGVAKPRSTTPEAIPQ
jgi:hypothetical protein